MLHVAYVFLFLAYLASHKFLTLTTTTPLSIWCTSSHGILPSQDRISPSTLELSWNCIMLAHLHIERENLLESELATTVMALPLITRARMGPVARAGERGIGIIAGPPAASRCCVMLRCEEMVCLRARLWDWDRSCGRRRRQN